MKALIENFREAFLMREEVYGAIEDARETLRVKSSLKNQAEHKLQEATDAILKKSGLGINQEKDGVVVIGKFALVHINIDGCSEGRHVEHRVVPIIQVYEK